MRPFKEYGISGISMTYCMVCFSGKPVVLFLSDVSGIAAVLLLIMCYIFENVCFTARVLSLNHRLLCVCVIPSSECTSTHSIVWILVSRPVWRSLEVHRARAVLVQLAAWWVSGSRSVTLCARIAPASDPSSLLVLNHNGSNSNRPACVIQRATTALFS